MFERCEFFSSANDFAYESAAGGAMGKESRGNIVNPYAETRLSWFTGFPAASASAVSRSTSAIYADYCRSRDFSAPLLLLTPRREERRRRRGRGADLRIRIIRRVTRSQSIAPTVRARHRNFARCTRAHAGKPYAVLPGELVRPPNLTDQPTYRERRNPLFLPVLGAASALANESILEIGRRPSGSLSGKIVTRRFV